MDITIVKRKRPRSTRGAIRVIIVGLVALSIAIFGLRLLFRQNQTEKEKSEKEALGGGVPESRKIKLYFVDPQTSDLTFEERDIYLSADHVEKLKQVLQEFINGSAEGLLNPIPKGTQLREIFLDKHGYAYVDFSRTISDAHIGGATAELLTIQAIVGTLQTNFPEEVKKVQILINGEEADTLAGHVDISKPLFVE